MNKGILLGFLTICVVFIMACNFAGYTITSTESQEPVGTEESLPDIDVDAQELCRNGIEPNVIMPSSPRLVVLKTFKTIASPGIPSCTLPKGAIIYTHFDAISGLYVHSGACSGYAPEDMLALPCPKP